MPMFYFSVAGVYRNDWTRFSVWAAAEQESGARQRVQDELARLGVSAITIEACEITAREDYFPPCESLAAFERAERDGFAYRIAPR